VAVAPGGPGNIKAVSDIISETADTVVVKSSVTLTINLRQPVVSDRNFVEVKLVGKSTQFPREFIGRYASSLVPIPPRLLYERRNIRGSQLKVGDFANYRSRRILVVTGTADVDHPRKLDNVVHGLRRRRRRLSGARSTTELNVGQPSRGPSAKLKPGIP
jgi:hypothetical protein